MKPIDVVILISANAEWRVVLDVLQPEASINTPFGGAFEVSINNRRCLFFQGGWGKVSAAASAQHVIDVYRPKLLMNLGTCGGFKGSIEKGAFILAVETVIYDIVEQMGDPQEAIRYYSAQPDLSWLKPPYPFEVQAARLVSADRDILPENIPMLVREYGAAAADWESGAIAWTAGKNNLPCLILRGVTDLVHENGEAEAYGNFAVFEEETRRVMSTLIKSLPGWIARAEDLLR